MAKTKKPDFVTKIGWVPVAIWFRPKNGIQGESEESHLFGRCSWAKDMDAINIEIEETLTGSRLVDTLLHELAHAISEIYGFDWCEQEVSTIGTAYGQALGFVADMLSRAKYGKCGLKRAHSQKRSAPAKKS